MSEEITKISAKSLNSLFRKIGFNKVHHDSTNEFEIHEFKLAPIKLDVHFITPFLFPKKNLTSMNIVSNDVLLGFLPTAVENVKRLKRKFGVLVINNVVKSNQEIINEFFNAKMALLTREDLEELLKENKSELIYDKFGLLLTKYLGTDFLSPYIPGRPAIGGRFFGRSHTKAELSLAKNNYIIFGIRRIGKTSLLNEVSYELKNQGYRIVNLYGGKCDSIEDVLYELYVELSLDKQSKEMDFLRKIYLSSNAINDFQRHIANEIKKERSPIAFFIDEFDHLIDIDERKHNRLSQIFRELLTNEDCRFYFAGFRKTKKATHTKEHAFFNFGKPISLKPFKQKEAYEMITTPLTRMGIKIDDDIIGTIYNQTAGLPEMIQLYCAEIVKFFNDNYRPPNSRELFKEVIESDDYKHKVQSSFLANTNAPEQLLCYLVIQSANEDSRDQIEFTLEDVKKLFTERNVKIKEYNLRMMIDNLQDSAIIEKSVGTEKFKFIIPELVNYIKTLNLDLNLLLETFDEHLVFEDTDFDDTEDLATVTEY